MRPAVLDYCQSDVMRRHVVVPVAGPYGSVVMRVRIWENVAECERTLRENLGLGLECLDPDQDPESDALGGEGGASSIEEGGQYHI